MRKVMSYLILVLICTIGTPGLTSAASNVSDSMEYADLETESKVHENEKIRKQFAEEFGLKEINLEDKKEGPITLSLSFHIEIKVLNLSSCPRRPS